MTTPNQYRSAQIYISHETFRWLQWLAAANNPDEHVVTDAVAEDILRKAILHNCPDIERIEAVYQKGRKALAEEAKAMLKSGHAKLDTGTGE